MAFVVGLRKTADETYMGAAGTARHPAATCMVSKAALNAKITSISAAVFENFASEKGRRTGLSSSCIVR